MFSTMVWGVQRVCNSPIKNPHATACLVCLVARKKQPKSGALIGQG